MKLNENRPKGSGDMERIRVNGGLTEKGHSYYPHRLCSGGLKTDGSRQLSSQVAVKVLRNPHTSLTSQDITRL